MELVTGLSPLDFHRLATTQTSICTGERPKFVSMVHIMDRVLDLCDDKLGPNSMHAQGTKAFLQLALATYAHDSAMQPGEATVAAREVLTRRGLPMELDKRTVDTALSYVGSQVRQTMMGGSHNVFYGNPVVAKYYDSERAIVEQVRPLFAN